MINPVAFIGSYLLWHYGNALTNIVTVWGNFIWFVFHFFSTFVLLRTLFAPWERMHETYPRKGQFDPGFFFGTLLVNLIMRIVGAVVRLTFILISVALFLCVFSVGVVFIAFWMVAPVGIFYLFNMGLGLILS